MLTPEFAANDLLALTLVEAGRSLVVSYIGGDYASAMRRCRTVCIWGRASSSVKNPSLDEQSVPRLISTSNHRTAGMPFIKEENQMQKTKRLLD
jgi:hypothetical protein